MKIMKKQLCFLLLAACMFQNGALQAKAQTSWPAGAEIIGETAIVMEASAGAVLYEKNAHARRYPASITKIMTALLAIENSRLDESVTFSHNAVYLTEGSGISRDEGEIMTMEQCLYALMLESANECAYAIAEHVGGSYDAFIEMMNRRAKELGCVDTHFSNPHGLPDESHYTSAYDMALIAKEAIKKETFLKIAGTKSYMIPPTNKHEEETPLGNSHQMLNPRNGAEYLYEGCIGGKTGYTSAARNTLVTFAKRNGMTLICVVLNEKATEQYQDTITLFDACFEHFQAWNIAENENFYTPALIKQKLSARQECELFINPDSYIVLPQGAAFTDANARITAGGAEQDGSLSYCLAGHPAGSVSLVVTERKAEEPPETKTAETQNGDIPLTEKKASAKHNIKYLLFLLFVSSLLLGARAASFRFEEEMNGSWRRLKRKIRRRIRKRRRK